MNTLLTDKELFVAHDEFAATEYGQRLAGLIRYARYNITDMVAGDWESLLGSDVNNLRHMPVTYGIGRSYLRRFNALNPGQLTAEDRQTTLLALLIHDQGESIIGDITYSEKTQADEIKE